MTTQSRPVNTNRHGESAYTYTHAHTHAVTHLCLYKHALSPVLLHLLAVKVGVLRYCHVIIQYVSDDIHLAYVKTL